LPERPGPDKHSSIFVRNVSDEEKVLWNWHLEEDAVGMLHPALMGAGQHYLARSGWVRLKNKIFFKNCHHKNKLINYNSEEVNRTLF
jgi:hypothetical protein